mmetsp:Transcript_11640/g.35874  ORF Transcript_11640/g.35874 Transcript_11640/m.35874 type:complete len:378 (+) Transcript_11640:626-1759(+)
MPARAASHRRRVKRLAKTRRFRRAQLAGQFSIELALFNRHQGVAFQWGGIVGCFAALSVFGASPAGRAEDFARRPRLSKRTWHEHADAAEISAETVSSSFASGGGVRMYFRFSGDATPVRADARGGASSPSFETRDALRRARGARRSRGRFRETRRVPGEPLGTPSQVPGRPDVPAAPAAVAPVSVHLRLLDFRDVRPAERNTARPSGASFVRRASRGRHQSSVSDAAKIIRNAVFASAGEYSTQRYVVLPFANVEKCTSVFPLRIFLTWASELFFASTIADLFLSVRYPFLNPSKIQRWSVMAVAILTTCRVFVSQTIDDSHGARGFPASTSGVFLFRPVRRIGQDRSSGRRRKAKTVSSDDIRAGTTSAAARRRC